MNGEFNPSSNLSHLFFFTQNLSNDLYNNDANLFNLTHLKAYFLFFIGLFFYKKINIKFDFLFLLFSSSIIIRVSMQSIEVFSSRGASLFSIFDSILMIYLLNKIIKDIFIRILLMITLTCLHCYLLFFVLHTHLIELY